VTDGAVFNQQGQLAPDQRASIAGWLGRQQLRALPPLLALVGLIVFADVLEGDGAGLLSSGGTLTLVTLGILGIAAIYALQAVRRIRALGTAKSMLNGGAQIEPCRGTVVKHGGERNAVLVDGRTWDLAASLNVCREARQLPPGAYTFYSLRLSVPVAGANDQRHMGGDGAWLLAADPLSGSDSLQNLLAQTLLATNGFLAEALPDNRAGRLSPQQAQKFSDANVVTYEGPVRLTRTLSRNNVQFHYYEAGTEKFSVSQRAFEALDEHFRYRLYYVPRKHELVNIEPLERMPRPVEISADGAPLSAAEVSRAVGMQVGEPQLKQIGPTGVWTYPLGSDRVVVAIIQTTAGLPFQIPFVSGQLRRGAPVAGLGEEAFFQDRHLVVRTGGVYLAIDTPGGQAAAENLARLALPRLKAKSV
jgi:hypothetical protein